MEPSVVYQRGGIATWRDPLTGTVKAKVVFKQLNTWLDGNPTPYGYDAMTRSFDGTNWLTPSRLYCTTCIPPAPENPEPSYEGNYVQERPVLLHRGNTSLAILQYRDTIKIMSGVDQELTGSPYPTHTSDMPRLVTAPVGALGTATATNEIAVAAWFKLESQSGTPRIKLKVWGKYPGKNGVLAGVPYTGALASLDRDFEARVLGIYQWVSSAEAVQFMVVFHQNRKLLATQVSVANNQLGSDTVVAVIGNPFEIEPGFSVIGHKLKGTTIQLTPPGSFAGLLLWTHEGHVRVKPL